MISASKNEQSKTRQGEEGAHCVPFLGQLGLKTTNNYWGDDLAHMQLISKYDKGS